MRKFQKTLNIVLAAVLTVTSFPVTTYAGESVKSSSASVSSGSSSSAIIKTTDKASDTVTDKVDLSSARLLVGTDDASVVADDQDHILSSYDGVYLIQYDSEDAAKSAYKQYQTSADFVDYDTAELKAADDEDVTDITDVTTDAMTEDTNPIASLEEATKEAKKEEADTSSDAPVIALIDTGASVGDNVIEAVSMLGDDASDDNGHGTKMVQDIVSENPNAKILSIKALDQNGKGTPSSVYAAIKYAMERKVKFINLSLSGVSKAENSAIVDVVKEAANNGIEVIGAAGNNGKNAKYYMPGSIDEAVIVGAADSNGRRLSASNYGDTVDYYVVAGSTSEATARMTGIFSKENAIIIDNQNIFRIVKDPDSKSDEANNDNQSGDITIANGGSSSAGAGGGTAIGNYNGFFVWHDDGNDASVDVNNASAVQTNMDDFRKSWIEKYSLNRALNYPDYNGVTCYKTLYERAAREALQDAASRSKTKKARIVGAIGIYTVGNDGRAFPAVNFTESQWQTLTAMRADDGGGLPSSLSWNSVHYNNGQATSQNWRQWLYEYGLNKVRNGAGFLNTTVIVYAIAEDEPTPPPGGKITIRLDKYLKRADTGGSQRVTDYTAYDNSDFTFEVKMLNFGGNYPSNYSVNSGSWYNWRPSTIHPGQDYSMDIAGVAGNYSSVSDWVKKNKYYVIAYRETSAPSGVTKDSGRDGDGWNYAVVTMSDNGSASVALGSVSDSITNTYNPPGGKLKIEVNKYVDGNLVGSSGTYTNNDFSFEAKMCDYGSSYPSNVSLSNGAWYDWKETLHPGQIYEKPVTGADVIYSSVDNWVAKNRYYAIAVRETDWPDGVTPDTEWKYTVFEMSANGSTIVATPSGSTPSIDVDNYTTPPPENPPENPTGYLRVKKSSSNPTITDGNSDYSFKDGVYGVYKDSDCTQDTGMRLTLNESGYSNTVELDVGTYYVKELTAPKGYILSMDVNQGVVSSGYTTTVNVTDVPNDTRENGYLKLHKSSSNPEMTNGNPCYSLKGAVYGVYKDKDCTQDTGKRLTTDANGDTNTVELEVGTYYVKELTVPKGYVISTTVKGDTVKEGETKTINVTDAPGTDPMGITINKKTANASANVPSLEGTEFTVKYYNNYYSKESELPSTPTRTWVFAAKYNSSSKRYQVLFNSSYKISGDDLYTVNGYASIPYGTITIQETKAASGYQNDASFTGLDGAKYGSVVMARVDDSGKFVSVSTGNSLSDTTLDVNDTLIPTLTTSLRNEKGEQYVEAKKDTSLTDTINIKNLNSYIGKSITVSGTLYDKATGQPLTINGKTVTASTTTDVKEETAKVQNTFTFNATELKGKTVVATESIAVDGKEVTSHKDLNDTEQMVFFPKISTILYQDTNGDKSANDDEKVIAFDLDETGKPVQATDDTKSFNTNVTLTDQVIYENLAPSKVYEVTGQLKIVQPDGSLKDTGIRSKETSFTTGAATGGNLTVSGSAEVHYNVDVMQYQNAQLVACETLNLSGQSVSAREEENVAAQRIRILVSTPQKKVSKPSNNRYEIHTWSIATKIPSGMEDSKSEQRGASFTDPIDSRLDYKGNARVDVVDSEEATANVLLTLGSGDYSVSGVTDGRAGGTLKVDLTASGLEKISKKQYEGVNYLRLRFDTLINQSANITPEDGVDIPNKVEIRWDDLGQVLIMHGNDHVTSGSVRIMKVDSNHQSLAGAKFILLNADKSRYQQNDSNGANPKDYPEQTSGTDGYAEWTGLEDGTYYIRETAAPNGKALQADDIMVKLQNHKVVSVNDTNVSNPVFKIADEGKLILQTGGPGRTIIIVVSIAAIAIAIFALLAVMKRQKKAEK